MKKLYSLFAAVVMAVAVNAQTTTVLTEDFSSYTKGGNTASSGNGSPDGDDVYVKGTNVSTFPTGTKVYQAGGMAKVGASAVGSMTTSELDLSTNGGNVRVTFDVKGWSSIEGPIVVTVGSTSKEVTYTALMGGTPETKSVEFPDLGTSATKVTIATKTKRAFIDNVKIETYSISSSALTVDQDALEFPQTLVGSTSEAQTLTVTGENLDAVPTYELSGADASEFSVSGSLTAEGGALSLTFHPATSGTKTATLTVTSGSLSQMVTLSGEGKALPVLTVDTDSMVFPETVVGETSDEEILEVNWANLSDLPAFEITGEDADAFEVANAVLKEDETGGYIHIVFKPSSTGIKTAVLTLTADGITKTVALSGTGVEDSSLSVGDTHTVKTGLVKNTLVDNVLVFTAKSEVNIYNFSGQTVKTASVSENTAVDVTGLPKGVYIVTGVVNGKNISQRIIKK